MGDNFRSFLSLAWLLCRAEAGITSVLEYWHNPVCVHSIAAQTGFFMNYKFSLLRGDEL